MKTSRHHRGAAPRAARLVIAALALAGCADDDGAADGGAADGGVPDGGAADGGAADAATGADASRAREVVRLLGDTLYPEGIAAAADGTLFVGSVAAGVILRVEPGADAPRREPFVASGDNGLVSPMGLLVDDRRGILWACSSDPGVAPGTGSAPPGLKAFDLDSGRAAGSFDLPGGGFCNDLAIDGAGAVYLTDSFGPRILRLGPGSDELETWIEDDAFSGEGFNLNGVAVRGEAVYAVKYNDGKLFRIAITDGGAAGDIEEIPVEPALELPDGLESFGEDLIVVEGVGRLTRVALGARATATVIESGLDTPTTAAIIDGDAWVVEGQLENLFDPTTGEPDLPFKVIRVPLE